MKPRRPPGIPLLRYARHGSWVLEIRYQGSALRDVFGLFTCHAKAREALAFVQIIQADERLRLLDQEGDDIVVEFFRAGWDAT